MAALSEPSEAGLYLTEVRKHSPDTDNIKNMHFDESAYVSPLLRDKGTAKISFRSKNCDDILKQEKLSPEVFGVGICEFE